MFVSMDPEISVLLVLGFLNGQLPASCLFSFLHITQFINKLMKA